MRDSEWYHQAIKSNYMVQEMTLEPIDQVVMVVAHENNSYGHQDRSVGISAELYLWIARSVFTIDGGFLWRKPLANLWLLVASVAPDCHTFPHFK